jgi:hypothetical protein
MTITKERPTSVGQESQPKTTVLLDVDGVVNAWRNGIFGDDDVFSQARVYMANGYRLCIPRHIPELVRDLTTRHTVHWCSAWRSEANRLVSPLLGIGPLPVVTDRFYARGADWKLDEVIRLLEKVSGEVVWIEDFAASWYAPLSVKVLEGRVHLVDTSEFGYLRQEHLQHLFEEGVL